MLCDTYNPSLRLGIQMFKIIARLLILFFIPALLTACIPSPPKDEIVHGVVGGSQYFVPKVLFILPNRHLQDDGIYIRTMYPDFTPVLEEQIDLLRKGEWYRNIRILASARGSNISFDEFAKGMQGHFKAFEYVSTEYGLLHHKQPEGYVQDHSDVWLEEVDGKYVSYISCSETTLKNDISRCSQNFFLKEGLRLKVSYNKKLLPYWKDIKDKTLELFKSFSSEEAAKIYINQKFQLLENLPTSGEK